MNGNNLQGGIYLVNTEKYFTSTTKDINDIQLVSYIDPTRTFISVTIEYIPELYINLLATSASNENPRILSSSILVGQFKTANDFIEYNTDGIVQNQQQENQQQENQQQENQQQEEQREDNEQDSELSYQITLNTNNNADVNDLYLTINIPNRFNIKVYIEDENYFDMPIEFFENGIAKTFLFWGNLINSTNLINSKPIEINFVLKVFEIGLGACRVNIFEDSNGNIATNKPIFRQHFASDVDMIIHTEQTINKFIDTVNHEIGHIFCIGNTYNTHELTSQPVYIVNQTNSYDNSVRKIFNRNNDYIYSERFDVKLYSNQFFIDNYSENSKAVEAYIDYFYLHNQQFTLDNVPGILIEDDFGQGSEGWHPEQHDNNYIELLNGNYLLLPGLQNSIMVAMPDYDLNSEFKITNITLGFLQDIGYIVNKSITLDFSGMVNPF